MKKNDRILFITEGYYDEIVTDLINTLTKKFSISSGYSIEFDKEIVESFDKNEYMENINKFNCSTVVFCIGPIIEKKSYETIVKEIESAVIECRNKNIRFIFNTIPCRKTKYIRYNKDIQEVAKKYGGFIADFEQFFRYERLAKYDGVRPDSIAHEIMVKTLYSMIVHSKLLVLWQYNGRYAHCNYACPYCYVATSVNKGMHFKYNLEVWEKAFDRHFGKRDTVFYFSYGEPLMGGTVFYEILNMIGKHPNWEVRMTSNISVNLERLLNTELAKTGRLNINASFHPTQIDIDSFISKCNQIRAAGIEPSIVYVMYPNQIDDFETVYLPKFRQAGYRVHIRAFRGLYKGKKYPQAYTKEQWIKTARYMDMGNFKYQINAINGLGRVSYLGMSHILVDNYGKIEMCDSYVGDRHYGNIFDSKIWLDIKPQPFPGLIPLAAVDDIADYYELGYDELSGNNINSYIEQGDVKIEDGKILYPLEKVDFSNRELIKKLLYVPKAQVKWYYFWLNPIWLCKHFIYSYVIKKYGKYVGAWFMGKYRLLREGKLSKKNFWHS